MTTTTSSSPRRPRHRRATGIAATLAVGLAGIGVPAVAGSESTVPANVATAVVGADAAWSQGLTGTGVRVAVVDTGIAEHADLEGRVVARLDVAPDSPQRHGHGTFMAGLVGGGGSRPVGIAPDVEIVDVRIADDEGHTSVDAILRGLQLVEQHRAELSIDVVLLAVGAPAGHGPGPIDRAVERLWRQGVVVVVPVGNEGPERGTVTSPGTAKDVITVGALDDGGTTDRGDDVVPSWSGAAAHGADGAVLVAPGVALVSLREDGSLIDRTHEGARVGTDRFRGSGTSMAAAVTAGAAALLLQARPDLTPDQVRHALVAGAAAAPPARSGQVAGGALDLTASIASLDTLPVKAPADEHGTDRGRSTADAPGSPDASSGGAGARPSDVEPAGWTWKGWTWKGWTWKGWTWKGWTWKGWTWR